LLKREQSKTDQRKVIISLTTKGNELQHEAAQIPIRLMQKLNIEPNENQLADFLKLKNQLNSIIDLLKNNA
jgi:DNA-binding MarR family transcriptional regulator